MELRPLIETTGTVIDVVGVAVLVAAVLIAAAVFLLRLRGGSLFPDAYRAVRQTLGRGILLGLELLVAADIIRTVAVEPTLRGVLVLGLIVLVRTFLSFSLEVELEGRWPWQRAGTGTAAHSASRE